MKIKRIFSVPLEAKVGTSQQSKPGQNDKCQVCSGLSKQLNRSEGERGRNWVWRARKEICGLYPLIQTVIFSAPSIT